MKSDNLFARYPLVPVFFFMTVCLLPTLLLRDFSPSNELRYLSIADEALAGGHIFAFFNQGAAYADKPPLYFWIIMLCRLIAGKHSMLLLALFSYIPALIIIGVMDKWIRLEGAGERAAMALMTGTCAMFLGMSVFLRMDMLMCLFITLALFTFYQWYEGIGNERRHRILFPVWTFLALFTKGPVGLLVPPLSVLCFLLVKDRGRGLGKYLGLRTWGIIALLCAAWFTGVWFDGGKDYLNNLLFHQTVDRAVNAFHHKKPFWYYLGAIWYTVAPWCLLLVGCVVSALRKPAPKAGRSDAEVLFLCVILSTFVMLSAFSSKLSIYLAPVFPFLVWLFPLVLNRRGWEKWMGWALGIPAGLFALIGIAALLVLQGWIPSRLGTLTDPLLREWPFIQAKPVVAGLCLLAAGGLIALRWTFKRKNWHLIVYMIASSLLLALYCASTQFPRINDFTAYGHLCQEVPAGTQVATLYVHRPENMDVYLGRDITDYGKDADAFLQQEWENRDPARGPLTLIAGKKAVEASPALSSALAGQNITFVGDWFIVTLTPEISSQP